MSIFSHQGSTLSAFGSPKWPWAFNRMRVPALVKQKVTIIFQCLLVNIFKAGATVTSLMSYQILTVVLMYSTWIWFLLTDDLRGKCVFVHTSPLAAMLFVSLWRLFNCSSNDIIMKHTTNMPRHKSSMTVACCNASFIMSYANTQWLNPIVTETQQTSTFGCFFLQVSFGRPQTIHNAFITRQPTKRVKEKESHTEAAQWNNQKLVLCWFAFKKQLSTEQGLVNWHGECSY